MFHKHLTLTDTEQFYSNHKRAGHFAEYTRVAIEDLNGIVCLLVACLTPQQHTSVSQGRICSDNFTCCHTETEVADQTFYLTQSQYTDTGPTSPSTDPTTPGAWQGSHWSANFEVTGIIRPRKNPEASGIRTRDLPLSRRDALTTRPTRRHLKGKLRWPVQTARQLHSYLSADSRQAIHDSRRFAFLVLPLRSSKLLL